MRHCCSGNDSIVGGPARNAALRQAQDEFPVGTSIEAQVRLAEAQPEKITNHLTGAAMWWWKPRQHGIGFKGTVVDQASTAI